MSTSISTVSPPRLLKPISGKIMNDGAAFVPLSPHKGVRNAAIIYEAIKNMPDQTLVRGDFDKKSRPLIYFPERPPKKVGSVPVDSVAAKNIRSDRAEFASFMSSIVESAYKAASPHSPDIRAAYSLRSKVIDIKNEDRDFTVGDIREPLRSIANAYKRRMLRQITSPHRTQTGTSSPVQTKRFKQFTDLNSSMTIQLCEALSLGLKSEQAEVTALAAIKAMKDMLPKYRVARHTEKISFMEYVQRYPIPRGVNTFAKLWLSLDGPDRSGRKQFCTESWALEMDRICPLIVQKYRAAKMLKHRGGSGQQWGVSDSSSLGSETESSSSSSQSTSSQKSKRRGTLPVEKDESPLVITPVGLYQFVRKSSSEERSHSSEKQVSFLDSQPEIKTIIPYSDIPIPSSNPVPANLQSEKFFASVKLTANDQSRAEERSTEPNLSNNAEVLSQDEY
jgi:hypothetical protein